ncbi:MAG: DUF4258 domain-containing protein [Desulfobulbaceae bacterium]|nr:DUF4258 domain-containing protein [Desulfobulbaceae bacterium]
MIKCKKISFSGHAVQRMYERRISKFQVMSVVESGAIIAEYPDDTPYPSYLLNGIADNKPLHLVVALDNSNSSCYIVTVYIPDPAQWTNNYQTRR